MTKRILSILLCVILVAALFSGCKEITEVIEVPVDGSSSDVSSEEKEPVSVPATAQLTFKTLPADQSVLLLDNPDRGWRSEEDYFVPTVAEIEAEPEKYTYDYLLTYIAEKNRSYTLNEKNKVSRVYFVMYNYKNDKVIPKKTIDYINNVCKVYSELGIKMYLGFYYNHYDIDNNSVPVEIRGGARKSVILYHIDNYYKQIWEKWEKAIYCVQMNLLGRYGEWTSLHDSCLPDGVYQSDISKEEYERLTLLGQQEIVAKVLQTVPQSLRINMRQPYWKTRTVDKSHPRYNRIGYASDAFFGKQYPNEEMGQSYWKPNNEGGWWELSVKEAPYSIMDGELYTTRSLREWSIYVGAYTSIQTMSELRFTTFSVNHAYGDINQFGGAVQETNIYGWKGEEVTPEILKDLGVLYTDNWFVDKNGYPAERNAFEYIRDYLGYHLSAKSLSVTGGTKAGEKIDLDMKLQNYGFSAVFNLTGEYVILDEENNVISAVKAGDPTSWHSTSAKNYSDRTQLTHTVKASMTLPDEKGVYKIAYRLSNALGQTARFDNTIEYSDGFNILHMFTVD